MNIHNFCIIAHIDHGKSTLSDRMLELTNTVEHRNMKDQVLDSMELERERGITIKMQPVRMKWKDCILNLIDTPGHIDFAYEVSRAMKAVEGAILLVDATQGVQAQTLSVLQEARDQKLEIIPVVTKIDSPRAMVEEVKQEIVKLLSCNTEDILEVSGKTGEGVENLLDKVVEKIPEPRGSLDKNLSALIFDFEYSTHKGVILFVRIINGTLKPKEELVFRVAKHKFVSGDIGILTPQEKSVSTLSRGEIGYIVTGIKEPGIASVGDTVGRQSEQEEALSGYMNPAPVVWASVYPEDQNDFTTLRQALSRLKLTDSSLTFEEEASSILGKGFRCGFLGMLHLEIISERLKREFDLDLTITLPSITYEVTYKTGKSEKIYSPAFFPDDGLLTAVREPWVSYSIITPAKYMGEVVQLLYEHEAELVSTDNWGDDRSVLKGQMPLRELMRGFFDKLKSASQGFASLSYDVVGERDAEVTRMDILVAEEVVPAFSRVVSRRTVEQEAEKAVEKLYNTLPRQMIVIKIQARALGRIISSKTLSAFRKDVTQHMYGGDITRKMKLREKQKKGKKKMQTRGRVNIPPEVFLKMIRPD